LEHNKAVLCQQANKYWLFYFSFFERDTKIKKGARFSLTPFYISLAHQLISTLIILLRQMP
jgi:hypothetical protein